MKSQKNPTAPNNFTHVLKCKCSREEGKREREREREKAVDFISIQRWHCFPLISSNTKKSVPSLLGGERKGRTEREEEGREKGRERKARKRRERAREKGRKERKGNMAKTSDSFQCASVCVLQ